MVKISFQDRKGIVVILFLIARFAFAESLPHSNLPSPPPLSPPPFFLKVPNLTAPELFKRLEHRIKNDPKFDPVSWNDKQEASFDFEFEGWTGKGRQLIQLAVWVLQMGNTEERKQLAKARKEEDQGKRVLLQPLTSNPVALIKENRELFEEISDSVISWDGSLVGYEMIYDPSSVGLEGDPVSFFMIHPIPQGGEGVKLATLAEISHAYVTKALEFKVRGLTEIMDSLLKKGRSATEKQADTGDSEAQFILARFFENGEGGPQDFSNAVEYYSKAAANGNRQAQKALNRTGFQEFAQVWREAHEGYFPSQKALIDAYLTGNNWVRKDLQKASQWLGKNLEEYLKSATEGPAEVQFGLGVIFSKGINLQKDDDQAKAWLNKAAALGHPGAEDRLRNWNDATRRINDQLAEFGMHFVALPGGIFTMGTPRKSQERDSLRMDNETKHLVELSPFWVMDTKLTREQWKNITGENPDSSPYRVPNWTACRTCPMTNVSWDDVQKVIKKLADRGIQAQLPTEAQQEYYMRLGYGERKTVTQTPYPWGKNPKMLDRFAWYIKNSGHRLHPVGTTEIPANSYGLKDVLGNAWEWADSWYGPYPKNSRRGLFRKAVPIKDPQGPNTGDSRAMRSCGWSAAAQGCRPAFRTWGKPTKRANVVGFRLVVNPGQSERSDEKAKNQ